MKLQSIELHGFKSFVDKTRLDFDAGITAILGPNGCGKSNVVDAVRWVLGSQSAKQLRGEKMDDVIFKGTTKRKPVGMAEVTLVFSNEDRGLPIDFNEVAIKRRVSRDGSSDYYLNGSLCRLKDLRDLFFASGVNNTAYSIIEESMIKQILNENNQELRHLLEEGSGITQYKSRRKETQRKLDRTQNDLLRLYDIIEEIGREVRSLRRQVGKARRHQKLFKEIRGLDLLLAGRQYQDLDQQEKDDRERLNELTTLAETDVGELGELRARIEATRPGIEEREAERRQLEEALQAFEEDLQEAERQVLLLNHRIAETKRRNEQNAQTVVEAKRRQQEIEGQIERMQEHLATTVKELEQSQQQLVKQQEQMTLIEEQVLVDRSSLEEAIQLNLEFIENDAAQRSRLREFQVKQENRQERIEILAASQQEIAGEKSEAAAKITDLTEQRDQVTGLRKELLSKLAELDRRKDECEFNSSDLQQQIAGWTARREAVNSRFELLKKIKDEYQGYGQGAKQVLQKHGKEKMIFGGMADCLQVTEEYTSAFETLFGQLLDAVVVDKAVTAVKLVDELREGQLGQASFLCGGLEVAGPGDLQIPTGGKPALELVSGKGIKIPHLERLLAATFAFADDKAAVDAAAGHAGPTPIICLSQTGLLITSDGVVRGGQGQEAEISILGRGEKLEKLTDEIADLQKKIDAAKAKLTATEEQRQEVLLQLQSGRDELAGHDDQLNSLQVSLAQLEDRQRTAVTRIEEIVEEQTRLSSEVAELAEQEKQMLAELSESGKQRSDSTVKRDELRQRVEESELERDEIRSEVEQLRLTCQRRESQQRENQSALSHLHDNVAELSARQQRLQQDIEVGKAEQTNLSEEYTKRNTQLKDSFADRERRRRILRAAADAIQELHEDTAKWHDRVKVIEDNRSGCREKIHEIETGLATLEIRRNNLTDRIEEQYKGRFPDLITSLVDEELPKELERDGDVFQPSQAAELLEFKRQKFNSLGPINHLALEEYETKKERLDFLEGQRDDVEKAKNDLTAAITQINRTARRLFVQTFEEVRRNYIAVFQTLFEGGRADLQLIRTDDPLESNIHITAQPSGKVVDHVSLLSGGERCLTALSILFAVYLVKPSPFCLLDEADAPLDDSNIRRFVRMLNEFSRNTQFLVITHNKLTMETANHLYGVTMMEQGVSSIVSVSFHDVADTQSDQELNQAINSRRRRIDQREKVREILADDQQEDSVRFTMSGGAGDGDVPVERENESGMRFALSETRETEEEPAVEDETPDETDVVAENPDDSDDETPPATRSMEAEN